MSDLIKVDLTLFEIVGMCEAVQVDAIGSQSLSAAEDVPKASLT